jgi:hypothetical protein
MARRGGLRRGVVVVAVTLGLGCTSPTLPLPPPALPTISVGTDPSTFHLRSERGAIPNALIVVVSRNESLARTERVSGTLADAQGSWELDVRGHVGDVLDVSQEDGTTRSPATSVTLK